MRYVVFLLVVISFTSCYKDDFTPQVLLDQEQEQTLEFRSRQPFNCLEVPFPELFTVQVFLVTYCDEDHDRICIMIDGPDHRGGRAVGNYVGKIWYGEDFQECINNRDDETLNNDAEDLGLYCDFIDAVGPVKIVREDHGPVPRKSKPLYLNSCP